MIEQRFTVVTAGGRARLRYQGYPVHLSGPASHCILSGYPDVRAAEKVGMGDGYNYVRHWCYQYGLALYADDTANGAIKRGQARLRAYPFGYNGISRKWNVTTIKPAHKTWLQGELQTAKENGVVLLISLFSNQDFRIGEGFGWQVCPWNPINSTKPDLFRPTAPPSGNTDSSWYWRQFINLTNAPARKEALKNYIHAMVDLSKDYWNVFFEICNEPQATLANSSEYLPFCDFVAAEIHAASEGKRMIIYNPLPNGSDFSDWLSSTTLQNAAKVHGVMFHRKQNPNSFAPGSYAFKDKVFMQLSTDAFRETDGENRYLREIRENNKAWADRLAPLDVDFEAYTFAPGCKGVLDALAVNLPTDLLAPPARKTSKQFAAVGNTVKRPT
jgi:hypothetical protein